MYIWHMWYESYIWHLFVFGFSQVKRWLETAISKAWQLTFLRGFFNVWAFVPLLTKISFELWKLFTRFSWLRHWIGRPKLPSRGHSSLNSFNFRRRLWLDRIDHFDCISSLNGLCWSLEICLEPFQLLYPINFNFKGRKFLPKNVDRH